MKNKLYINLSGVSLNSLHPILKNFYNKLENFFYVKYLNVSIDLVNNKIPKTQNKKGIYRYISYLKIVANKIIPRVNIIKGKNKKILTDNNFLLTKNEYSIITSSLIQFSGLKVKPLHNIIFKKIFKFLLLQKNLKKIIFYSETSYNEFIKYCINKLGIDKKDFINKLDIFYPILKDKNYILEKEIINRFNIKKISFLFIARHFLGKGGYELIKALEKINILYPNIKDKFEINIVSDIPDKFKKQLLNLKNKGFNINLYGIDFTQNELENKFYKNNHILLHLTRADLFGMVSLESKKNGLAVITTDQYLNPELFSENEALFVRIKEKYKWNNGLPIVDYIDIWNLEEEEVLNIDDIVKNIIFSINNKEKMKVLAINNLFSLEKYINDDKKIKELF